MRTYRYHQVSYEDYNLPSRTRQGDYKSDNATCEEIQNLITAFYDGATMEMADNPDSYTSVMQITLDDRTDRVVLTSMAQMHTLAKTYLDAITHDNNHHKLEIRLSNQSHPDLCVFFDSMLIINVEVLN